MRSTPASRGPHFVAKLGVDRGAYVRVASTNRRADTELLDEMRRASRGEVFDEQPLPELDPEAIDFRVASGLFAEFRTLRRSDLKTLRLVTTHQGRVVPTIGGVLLFGVERERHFPDSWIQVGRFSGTDKAQIIDSAEIHSHPAEAIDETIVFVRKHLTKAATIGASRRTDHWSLPPVALREAIVNAVAHSDYAQRGGPTRVAIFDDRIEVENPGLLPLGLTIEDIHRGVSKLRNRVIGRVLRELGLMEQWGSGVQRMTEACRDAGLPDPLFEELGGRFRVTISTVPNRPPTFDPIEEAILAMITERGEASTTEIAQLTGLSARAARTRLARLVERDLLRLIGSGPYDPTRRYVLTRGER